MAQLNRTSLENYFIAGARPTEAQFADLIESCFNMVDDTPEIPGLTIDAQGRMGIGTSTPTHKLTIDTGTRTGHDGIHLMSNVSTVYDLRIVMEYDNVGNNAHYIFDDGSNGHALKLQSRNDLVFCTNNLSERMRIRSNGYVGIGIANPTVPLNIYRNNPVTLGLGSGELVIGAETGTNLAFDRNEIQARSNGAARPLSLNRFGGDVILVQNGGNVGIGTSPETQLHLSGGAPMTPTGGGDFTIGVVDGLNLSMNRNMIQARNNTVPAFMAINWLGGDVAMAGSGGRVGIGTSTPSYKLTIGEGASDYTNYVEINSSTWAGILFHGGGRGGYVMYNHSGNYMYFGTSPGDDTGPYERMRITSDGHVGIGATNPVVPLQIVGGSSLNSSVSDNLGCFVIGAVNGNNLCFDTNEMQARHDGATSTLFLNHWGGNITMNYNGGNVGIGRTASASYRLDVDGNVRCDNLTETGGDYAEFFESFNGKSIPVGTPVILTGNGKIKPAVKGDTPIGIISGQSAIIANSAREWPQKIVKDEYGASILEEYQEELVEPKTEKIKKKRQKTEKKTVETEKKSTEVVLEKGKYRQKEVVIKEKDEIDEPVFEEADLYDASGKNKIGTHRIPIMEEYDEEVPITDDEGNPVMVGTGKFETKTREKINPEYDESQTYILREERPEWHVVGLLGQLPMTKGKPVAPGWVKIKNISKKVELWLVK